VQYWVKFEDVLYNYLVFESKMRHRLMMNNILEDLMSVIQCR
jgi:hypothetical protein